MRVFVRVDFDGIMRAFVWERVMVIMVTAEKGDEHYVECT